MSGRTLPFFAVQKESVTKANGQTGGEIIYYTVPTRQFTPQQLAQMGVTNAIPHPAAPK